MGTTMAITSRLLKMSAIFVLLAGCAEVTVHRTDNSHLLEDWRTSLMEPDGGISIRTMQTLRQVDLERVYHDRPVDAFIRARLAEKQLTRSPVAERRALMRRLSYDITGLPPTSPEGTRIDLTATALRPY